MGSCRHVSHSNLFPSAAFPDDVPTLFNGKSHLLLTFVPMTQKAQLPNQKLTEATAISHVVNALRSLPGFVEPTKVYITKWSDNELIRGAWEIWKIGETFVSSFGALRAFRN